MAHRLVWWWVLAFLMWLAMVGALFAQTGTPTSLLAWDQVAPDLASAQGYRYTYYPDGAATGTVLAAVTCTGAASPFACTVAFPAFTPGPHTLQLTARNIAGESPQSAALAFTFVVIPTAPQNLRIQ